MRTRIFALELDHSEIREFWQCAWHCLRVKKCGSTELKCCFIFFIFCSESQWDMRDIRRTHEHWMSIQKRSWVKLKMKGFLTHAKSINLCTQQKHLTLAATNAFIIWFFIKKNYMQNWHLNNDQSKRISQHFAYLVFFSSKSGRIILDFTLLSSELFNSNERVTMYFPRSFKKSMFVCRC